MTYLDNAATSFPKPTSVIEATLKCITEYCGNPGRSSHYYALESAYAVYRAREAVADFLGFPYPERVVFTQNATHALNIAIKGLLSPGDHVLVSDIEHNSVLRPLYTLEEERVIEVSTFDSDVPIESAIGGLIRRNTRFLVMSLASNVTGKVLNPREIYDTAKKYGLMTIIDLSQFIGHNSVNWRDTPFDVMCAPGHKALFGIQGSGFAVFSKDANPSPLLEGGTGTNSLSFSMPDFLPERMEAGTLNTPAIVSMAAGIEYLRNLGKEAVTAKIMSLTSVLNQALHELPLVIHGCNNGICSFTHLKLGSDEVVERLNDAGICIRSGIHCAPLIHRKLHLENIGSLRASLSILNTEDDIYALYRAIKSM